MCPYTHWRSGGGYGTRWKAFSSSAQEAEAAAPSYTGFVRSTHQYFDVLGKVSEIQADTREAMPSSDTSSREGRQEAQEKHS